MRRVDVDHRFHYAGFDADKIYTPQGDMALLQCAGPCLSLIHI